MKFKELKPLKGLVDVADFIANFQTYFENILEMVKDLTGIEIDFSVIVILMEEAETFVDFISSVLEFILAEVSSFSSIVIAFKYIIVTLF